MKVHDLLGQPEGLDWDEGNRENILLKHDVAFWEIEVVFFDRPLVLRVDFERPGVAARFYALGRTEQGRSLFVAFTLRRNLVRVPLARDMTRRELAAYARHHEEEDDP